MHILTKSAVLGLSLALGACGTSNRGLESVHQPVVSRTDYVIDLASGGGGLAAGEQERLAEWFSSIELGYGDRVSVDQRSSVDAASATSNCSDPAWAA